MWTISNWMHCCILAKVNHSNMIQMDVMNTKIERINSNAVNESQMEEKQNTEYVAPKDDMIINGESDNECNDNVTKGNETPHLNQVENEEFVVNTDRDGETMIVCFAISRVVVFVNFVIIINVIIINIIYFVLCNSETFKFRKTIFTILLYLLCCVQGQLIKAYNE